MTGEVLGEEKKICMFGFSKEEQEIVANNIPEEIHVRVCDNVLELLVEKSIFCFVNPSKLTENDFEQIIEFGDD